MKATFSPSLITALTMTVTSVAIAAVETSSIEAVVMKMQSFYNATQDLKGDFKQVYTDALYGRQRTSYGYLYVRKPGMMRWNYVKPEKKSFIADGKILWIWEPEDKQAFRNALSTDTLSSGLTFLLGTGDLLKEFSVEASKEQLGAPEDILLKMTPQKATPQYSYILLALRPQDFSVRESVVVGKQNRNHFIFGEIQRNTKLSIKVFQFKPSADTKVIDGRKLNR